MKLLKMEADEEAAQQSQRNASRSIKQAEASGETLADMAVEDEDVGLGGRLLVRLVKRNRELSLPWTRLRPGSPVLILPATDGSDGPIPGVVSEKDRRSITVAVSEPIDVDRFHVVLAADEISRKRQTDAMRLAENAEARTPLGRLRDVLLLQREPEFQSTSKLNIHFFAELNESQQTAIQRCLAAQDLAIIHGPPGTGKTTTVVELIRQLVMREQTVLACAPSNHAVDNLMERLIACGVNAVRLGHPARVLPAVRQHTLDLMVREHENLTLAKKLIKDAMALHRQADRFTRSKPKPGQRRELRTEAKELFADARRLERQAVQQILDRADVVCATTSLDVQVLGERVFDCLMIDEACQSTEAGCWPPLTRAHKLVLAGDHCQLPPTVVSNAAAKQGLGISLQECLVEAYGDNVTSLLNVQYRMHQDIMSFSSQQFYEDKLVADASVCEHTLLDLPQIDAEIDARAIEFYDTAGADFVEEAEADGESRFNRREAKFLIWKLERLIKAGVTQDQIAVIAPYAAQVRWLRSWADGQPDGAALEIDSVDGFQGREKEVVLFSLVRSNPQGDIGFLKDLRRTNVAMTRAKRKLILIGDSATLAGHEFYAGLIEYVQEIGAYHSVWEEDLDGIDAW
ncbi:MAG: AAA domain-containing protein [Pirellulaceae bacterium]